MKIGLILISLIIIGPTFYFFYAFNEIFIGYIVGIVIGTTAFTIGTATFTREEE